jgi:hypothetical protein
MAATSGNKRMHVKVVIFLTQRRKGAKAPREFFPVFFAAWRLCV